MVCKHFVNRALVAENLCRKTFVVAGTLRTNMSPLITATASCLDSLLTSSSVSNLFRTLRRAAGRLIFRIRRSEHITAALISLYWLRVTECISCKLAVMTYRFIHGTSPYYLQSCFIRVSDMIPRR